MENDLIIVKGNIGYQVIKKSSKKRENRKEFSERETW